MATFFSQKLFYSPWFKKVANIPIISKMFNF